jgi:hypothetical protein
MVDTRSFSQKYGSWESDRNGNKCDPEAAAAEMSAKFSAAREVDHQFFRGLERERSPDGDGHRVHAAQRGGQ